MSNKLARGYIQVYTGDGKGKTTAALGLAIRAAGHGFKSYIAQFMKGEKYGELKTLASNQYITIEQFGNETFVHIERTTPEDVKLAQQGLDTAREKMCSNAYDIVILDEINVALYFNLLSIEDVLHFIRQKPEHVELILTGRR